MKAALVLEDGSVWTGEGFGAPASVSGEVVFNTGMVGYPESLTDPSYHGQILCQTYPLIGNYGVSAVSLESDRPHVRGYIVAEICLNPSHWTSRQSLPEWLEGHGVPVLSGVDTRALTKKLRAEGVMLGLLRVASQDPDPAGLREEARRLPDPNARDLVAEVTCPGVRIYSSQQRRRVVLIDCGVKAGILQALIRRGVQVIRVPSSTPFERIMDFAPGGVVISNGPGDPARNSQLITAVKRLLRERVHLFGICLGHQLLALAAGGSTFKLKFGHRSQNQPCQELGTKNCHITSQNHGYAVEPGSLPRDWRPWFLNANDQTNEGLIHRNGRFRSVQFHPEARPGPTDTEFLFDEFVETLG